MLPNLIYSIITTAVVCIGFAVYTIAAVFDLGPIDSKYRHAMVVYSIIIGNRMPLIDEYFPELDGLNAQRTLVGGIILLLGFIYAGLFQHS